MIGIEPMIFSLPSMLYQEAKSLEWLYNYIYRFNSAFAHQGLNAKEKALDLVWDGKGYGYLGNNDEVLGLLIYILDDLRKIK